MNIQIKNKNLYKKALSAEFFLVIFLVFVFSIGFAKASDLTPNAIIELVNNARKEASTRALARNDSLQKAAEEKAQDMLDNNYFAHVSPQGKSPWFWFESVGYDYNYAGENLAINYKNAEEEQTAWMNSPLHRKNILNPAYQEIGVAVKEGTIDGQKAIVAVQMFGSKLPEIITTNSQQTATTNVAGITGVSINNNSALQNISVKLDPMEFYRNNKVVFFGWLIAISIAFIIIILDVLALFHKKHEQLFILHDARKRHI